MRVKALVVPLLLALALSVIAAGCVTYIGHNQSCRTTKLFGTVEKMTCSGSAKTVRGEGSLTFGEDYGGNDDNNFSGDYRLEMTASVEQGRMDIYTGSSSGREGGEVSPGKPLNIEAAGGVISGVDVKVKGGEDAEVKGFKYEATIERLD